MMNLFCKLMALLAFLGGLFGITVGLLFILCVNALGILGLLCAIVLFIMGWRLIEVGQIIVDKCVEREVLTEEEH